MKNFDSEFFFKVSQLMIVLINPIKSRITYGTDVLHPKSIII